MLTPDSRFVRALIWVAKPKVQTWFNGFWTVFWLVMMCLTPIFVHTLFSAIWFVAFISAWALFATHLGAWIAALVNVKAERITNRTEQGAHFARIEEAEDKIIQAVERLWCHGNDPCECKKDE